MKLNTAFLDEQSGHDASFSHGSIEVKQITAKLDSRARDDNEVGDIQGRDLSTEQAGGHGDGTKSGGRGAKALSQERGWGETSE
jgi:hypothetical protein